MENLGFKSPSGVIYLEVKNMDIALDLYFTQVFPLLSLNSKFEEKIILEEEDIYEVFNNTQSKIVIRIYELVRK